MKEQEQYPLPLKSDKIARWERDKSAPRRIKSVKRSRKEIALGRFYTIVYLLFQFLSLAFRRHRRSRFAVGAVCSFSGDPRDTNHFPRAKFSLALHITSNRAIVSFSLFDSFGTQRSGGWQKSKSKCLFACSRIAIPFLSLLPLPLSQIS